VRAVKANSCQASFYTHRLICWEAHLYLAPPPRVLAAHGGTTKAEKKHDG